MNEIKKEILKYLKQIKKSEKNSEYKFQIEKSIKQVKNCEKLLDITHPNLNHVAAYDGTWWRTYFMSVNGYSKQPDGSFKVINILIDSEINFKGFESFLKSKKRNKKINQILN
jgi:hypothetical protein